MKQTIWKSILFSSLLASSPISMAEQSADSADRPHKKPRFPALDLNSDGQLTLDEFKQRRIPHRKHQRIFNHMDQNQDGVVTSEEFRSHRPPKKKREMKQRRLEAIENN